MNDQLAFEQAHGITEDQSALLARIRLEDELGTLRHAEQVARAHGRDKLADELRAFSRSLGSPSG